MIAVLILAVGLAMDAVAVALVRGATGARSLRHGIEVALAFGIAQGVMPLFGWGLGAAFAGIIEAIDHWIAFGLLALLGGKMLYEAAAGDDDDEELPPPGTRSRMAALGSAALATSIDAAAAGITLPLFALAPLLSCLVIGVVTALLSGAAYWIGGRASPRSGKLAEVLGGVALIAIGTRILIEHLSA